MTGFDDSPGDMTFREDSDACLDAALESALTGGPVAAEDVAVAAMFADLRTLAEQPAPAPSQALASLLAGGTDAPTLGVAPIVDLRDHAERPTRPYGRAAVTGGIVAAVLLGSVGAAAARGGLPRQAQNAVADALDALTPFTVPHAPAAPVSGRSSAPAAVHRSHHASRSVPVPVEIRPVAVTRSVQSTRRLAGAGPGDQPEPAEAVSGHAGATDRTREPDVRAGDTGDEGAVRPAAAARQDDASPDGGSAALRRSDSPPLSGSDSDSDSSPSSSSTGSSPSASDGSRTAEAEPPRTEGSGAALPAPVQAPAETQPESELVGSGEPVRTD